MFCFQCEQTSDGTACIAQGVCGKDPKTAALQDLVVYSLKGVSMYAHRARLLGASNAVLDRFVVAALFTTLTNVNFDISRFETLLQEIGEVKHQASQLYTDACASAGKSPELLSGPALWEPSQLASMLEEAATVSVLQRRERVDGDIASTQELLTYGLKGLAAYAHHAVVLGMEDTAVFAFIHEAMDSLTKNISLNVLLSLCLRVGEHNLRAMELLDQANTNAFGNPEPTSVRIHPKMGKAILVSGHDLADLYSLLQQTAGKGINIYTHGELLPGNAYPKLKEFPHLVGNYGGAWQNQAVEFSRFPGAVLVTTNCIQKPRQGYQNRLFTCGQVGWPDVTHIDDRNFSPVIEAALAAPGFTEDGPDSTILIGFGHHALMNVAGKVIDAVKSGDVKHFYLVGGCDGARPGRNYYTDVATSAPSDSIIMTLGCGKYRFNKHDFGTVAGLPRLLDLGQCNDAYSAIKIASALADAFGCGVNDLPLTLILSWYEQKAVSILLTLLHLGIKNIKIGPSLPAFITPNVLQILVENYALAPISTPERDLEVVG